MSTINFKKFLPHLAAIAIFILCLFAYFPELLENKSLRMDDIEQHKGMSNELADYRERTGEESVWTNTMFGGMPGYLISVVYKGNLLQYVNYIMKMGLPFPADTLFILMTGMYALLLVLTVRQPLAVIGAVVYAFSSYNLLCLEAGHTSKVAAIAYMPWVLMAVILTLRGRLIWGALLTALFMSLEIRAGHVQITYYLSFIVLLTGIAYFVDAAIKKTLPQFAKAAGLLVVAAILGVFTNSSALYMSYDYGKDSIRGKSELTIKDVPESDGLDKNYALEYSYGVGESFSYMIPNVYGGASNLSLGEQKEAMKGVEEQYKTILPQLPQYWADTSTTGPFYIGALICFLCVLGFFLVEGPIRWAFLASMLLAFMLSWGKNFEGFSVFMLENFPGYNKFRAVKMTLVITDFLIPLMAILGLNEVVKRPEILSEKRLALGISFAATAGLCLVFWLMPDSFFTFDYLQEGIRGQLESMLGQNGFDKVKSEQWINGLISNLEQVRMEIFKADALRAFLLITAGAAALFAYSKLKFNPVILAVLVFFISVGDLFSVDKRYVNKKDFVNKTKSLVPFEPSVADEFIYSRETSNEPEIGQRALAYRDEALKRKKRVKSGNNAADENKYRFLGLMANTNYRVLNLSTSTFNDAATSYFHKSVGGYSAVKLERYQEMIEFHIQKNMKSLSGMLRGGMTDSIFQAGMQNQYALNMLNTRYIIYNSEANPLVNEAALGNAWFVKEVKRVKNADEEIQAMNAGFDPARTAIVDERFSDQIPAKLSTYTEDNNIRLESYAPNALRYKCAAADKSVVVFSEIYYAKGWKSYLDGKEVPHFRANYILRGMVVPQGDHQIEFKFEPEQLYTTEAISYTASSILIALLLLMVGIELKRRKPSVAK